MKNTFTKLVSRILLILCLLFTCYTGFAQYTLNTISSGQGLYTAMAKDQYNNIYMVRNASTSGPNYEVVKFAGGNPAISTVLITGLVSADLTFVYSWGLAVNSLGDVFVTNADQNDGWEIIKWTKSTMTQAVIHSGNFYSSLAVDKDDNLLSLEYDGIGNSYQVWKYPAGAEGSFGFPVYNGLPFPSGALSYPWGLSVDSHNDIYFLGFLETDGGSLFKLSYPAYNSLTTIGTNKSYTSLTIDAADNLYTSEGTSPSTAQVVKYTYPVAANATGTVINTALSSAALAYPWGLAVNSNGQIFANDAAATGNGRLIRLDPPTSLVSAVTRLTASPTNAGSVTFGVVFNRAVTGVSLSTFNLNTTGVTGASLASVSGSGTLYLVTVNTGSGDGTIKLDVNGAGVSPTATNVPYIAGQVYTIDKTKPTGSLVINAGATLTNNGTVTLTTAASDASAGMQMRFSNDGTNWSSYESFAVSKSWGLSAGDGLKTVYVEYKDAASNSNSYSATITLDQAAPQTTILTGPPSPTNSSSATFTFSSSEAGSTFQYSVDGGSYIGAASPLTINSLAEGARTFAVRATDPAGNVDLTAANYFWTIDKTGPTVSSVSVPSNGYYKAGLALNFTVNYSENIVVNTIGGVPYLDVVLNSGTVRAVYATATSNTVTFSYTVQPGDADMNGISLNANLQLNAGIISDAAGNASSVALLNVGSLTGVYVNTVTPTAVLSKTDPALVNHAVTTTITFSEAVTGLTTADFSLLNATLSNLITSDNITYTVSVVPTADGAVSIILPAATVANIGDNPNSASNALSFTYDATKPTVSLVDVPVDSVYNENMHIDFPVYFSENVLLNTTVGTPYINLTIGAAVVRATLLSNNSPVLTFRYTVQAGDMDMDGITMGALVLNGATLKDAAGNDAVLTLGAVYTAGQYVNTTHPSVVVSTTAAANLNSAYTATITFSSDVSGLALNELLATNATLSNLQTTDNIVYTVLVTPTTDGPVTLQVPADAAYIYRNGNLASNVLSRIYDIANPVISSVTVPANAYYKAGDVLSFKAVFSEPVTVTGTPYIKITIGNSTVQASLSSTAASSLTFSYTVVNGDQDMDGIAVDTLELNGGTIQDAVGNNALLMLNNTGSTAAVFVNTTHPTVVVSATAAATLNAAYTATITFSEAVTGFIASDIAATNATVSNLQTADNITYTAQITPAADGTVTVTVPAVAALNIGVNGNSASNTLSRIYDATAPTVTSVDVPANAYYKTGQDLAFTVHFSEAADVNTTGGTPYLNLVIGSTTVRAVYNSTTLTYIYTVQDGDTDVDGVSVGTLVLNGGSIRDLATNNAVLTLNNISATTGVRVNTATPAVVISTNAAARINTPFDVTLVFSEAVTGLLAADLNITNGTAANLQTTDNITYTVTVTPATDGQVSIFLPAAQAENVVANGNRVSNTISLVYDITAPLITAGQTFTTSEKSPAGTLVGIVTAIETAGTLQNWTISSDESGGAFSIDNGGKLVVNDAAILSSHANSTVHLTITVSDGLNINTGESIAVSIKFVNQAPTLDVVSAVKMCTNTDETTIQLTGASAVETDQTYSFSVMTDQSYFDVLSVSATGLITYKLKAGAAGTATVTVTIKDNGGNSNGGVDSLRSSFTVTANSLPLISISSDKGATISKGDIVHLTVTGGNSYSWNAADGNISGEQSDILEARPMINTTYKVTVTNAEGCFDTAGITVKVIEDFKVDAINIMSPNGDGKNDKWVIQNIDSYPNNEVKIFDRTGRMVYSRRNYNNEWDATMNGSPLAEGTYYYILTFGANKTAKGYITIIRDKN